jgi:hypothetical protein
MNTEAGEHLVGAYLKYILKCDVVDYNVREPEGGLVGLNELDVVGLRFKDKTAYVCEVTTHTKGMNKSAELKLPSKLKAQRNYANANLKNFKKIKYMVWSPKVQAKTLQNIYDKNNLESVELIVNEKYLSALTELNEFAKTNKKDTSNPFIRFLQIMNACNSKFSVS